MSNRVKLVPFYDKLQAFREKVEEMVPHTEKFTKSIILEGSMTYEASLSEPNTFGKHAERIVIDIKMEASKIYNEVEKQVEKGTFPGLSNPLRILETILLSTTPETLLYYATLLIDYIYSIVKIQGGKRTINEDTVARLLKLANIESILIAGEGAFATPDNVDLVNKWRQQLNPGSPVYAPQAIHAIPRTNAKRKPVLLSEMNIEWSE